MVETIDWDETQYLTEVNAGYCWAEKFDAEKFHKLILMQFTGQKDKNGAEIYEGDIVKWYCDEEPPEGIFIVEWRDTRFVLYNKEMSDWALGGAPKRLEIIGNIYENKELI